MGADCASRFVPVNIIGCRMRIVFILLAAMVFEAAYSAEIDEFDAFDAVSESHGSENMELQQDEVAVADNVQSKASKWREIWQKRKEKELKKIKGSSNGKKKLKKAT